MLRQSCACLVANASHVKYVQYPRSVTVAASRDDGAEWYPEHWHHVVRAPGESVLCCSLGLEKLHFRVNDVGTMMQDCVARHCRASLTIQHHELCYSHTRGHTILFAEFALCSHLIYTVQVTVEYKF